MSSSFHDFLAEVIVRIFLNRFRHVSNLISDYIFDTGLVKSVSDTLELKNIYYRKIFETSMCIMSKFYVI